MNRIVMAACFLSIFLSCKNVSGEPSNLCSESASNRELTNCLDNIYEQENRRLEPLTSKPKAANKSDDIEFVVSSSIAYRENYRFYHSSFYGSGSMKPVSHLYCLYKRTKNFNYELAISLEEFAAK